MRVACPECDAALRLNDDLPAGKQVRCPKCQKLFAVPKSESAAISSSPPRSRPVADRDDDETDEPRRPRRRFKPKKQQSTSVLPAVLLGGLALLILAGAAVGGIWWLTRTKTSSVAEATEANKPVNVPSQSPAPPSNTVAPQPIPEPAAPTAPNYPPPFVPPTMPANIPNVPPQQPADRVKPPEPKKPEFPEGVGLEVGKIVPEIEGEDLDGKEFKLSDYRGKVVLLDFWGNW